MFSNVITVSIDRKRPSSKHSIKSAIRVGRYSFAEYIGKRLIKDGLGFIPLIDSENHAYTQRGSHIVARIPENAEDFLIYCHELGHNKTFQPESRLGYFAGVDANCLTREFNAWKWGIKYFQRLGFTMSEECKKCVKQSFESYTNGLDKKISGTFEEELSDITGIKISAEEPKHNLTIVKGRDITFSNDFTLTIGSDTFTGWDFGETIYRKPAIKVEKPKNHKPWHDLKSSQIKKQWRNQR